MRDTDKPAERHSALEQAIEACMEACGEFAVVVTKVHGKPAPAIVSVSEDGPGYIITPLPDGSSE